MKRTRKQLLALLLALVMALSLLPGAAFAAEESNVFEGDATYTEVTNVTDLDTSGVYIIFGVRDGNYGGRALYHDGSAGSLDNWQETITEGSPATITSKGGDKVCWTIEGNRTDGYSIAAVSGDDSHRYLQHGTASSGQHATQLTVGSNPALFSITPNGNAYRISWKEGEAGSETTTYLDWNDKWGGVASATATDGVIRIFKQTHSNPIKTMADFQLVEGIPSDGFTGRYLIVIPNGSYYVVAYPDKQGSNHNAGTKKLVVDNGVATGLVAYNATDTNDQLPLTDALWSITGSEGSYHISNGNYSLGLTSSHMLSHPVSGCAESDDCGVNITYSAYDGCFTVRHSADQAQLCSYTDLVFCARAGQTSTHVYLFQYNKVSKSALAETIAAANELTEGHYTAETWSALQTALGEATTVNNNAGATQDEVDAARAALQNAINALERKPLTIPGYTQVETLDQITDGYYLIVARVGENYFTLYPSDVGDDPGNAKKMAYDDNLQATGWENDEGFVTTPLTKADNLFRVQHNGNAVTATISAKKAIDDSPLYLALKRDPIVYSTSAGSVTVTKGVPDKTFRLEGYSYLLYNTLANKNFNQAGKLTNSAWYPDMMFFKSDRAAPALTLTETMLGGGGDNTWAFTGGRAVQGTYEDIGLSRTAVSHFEEYVRWAATNGSGDQGGPRQRYVFNLGYDGQTLGDIVTNWDRVKSLKPKAVVYAVGPEDMTATDETAINTFKENLGRFIDQALTVRNTAEPAHTEDTYAVIVKPYETASNGAAVTAINTAIDAVVDEKADRANQIKVVSSPAFTGDDAATYIANGYPTAKGQLKLSFHMAQEILGFAGAETAYPKAGGRDYNGLYSVNWPGELVEGTAQAVTLNDAYRSARDALRTRMSDTTKPTMTWLFLGDSITHGAEWSEGQDTISQLFEKFVKNDLDRKQDVVLSTAVSGADTATTVAHINERVKNYTPDVVAIMLGTNDAASEVVGTTAYKDNLKTILDAIFEKNSNAVVALRTPIPDGAGSRGEHIHKYVAAMKEVAADTKYAGKNIIVVDQFAEWAPYLMTADDETGTTFLFGKVFTADGTKVHPGPVGHLWMTQELIRDLGLWSADRTICKLHYHQDAAEWGVTAQPNAAVDLAKVFTYDGETGTLTIPTASLSSGGTLLSATVTVTAGAQTYTGTALRGEENVVIDLSGAAVTNVTIAATALVQTSATAGSKFTFAPVGHVDLTAAPEEDPTPQANTWKNLEPAGSSTAAGSVADVEGGVAFTGVNTNYNAAHDIFVNETMDAAIQNAPGTDKYVSFTFTLTGETVNRFGFALRVHSNAEGFYIGYDSSSKFYTQCYNDTASDPYRKYYDAAATANTPYTMRLQWNDTTVRIWINDAEMTVPVNQFLSIPAEGAHQFAVRDGGSGLVISNLHYSGDGTLDTFELDYAIRLASTFREDDYSTATWAALTAALAGAEEAKQGAGQQAVYDATDALTQAIDGLRLKPVIPAVPEVPAGATKHKGDDEALLPSNHNETTNGQPYNDPAAYPNGVAGSEKFRIPAMITLKHQKNDALNGRLVAAMDARWDHTGDAFGLDTLVAYSDNDGGSWGHTYANYFADSAYGCEPRRATVFIDPVLAEGTDGTIYLMTDLFPAGVATLGANAWAKLVTPARDTGYRNIALNGVTKQRMILYTMTDGTYSGESYQPTRNQTDTNWTFFVGDFEGAGEDKYATIYTNEGEPTELYVDEYYYLYKKSGAAMDPDGDRIYCPQVLYPGLSADSTEDYIQQNVFFYNSILHARCASYLWVVKSTDGGVTWSKPTILNDQVRYDPAQDEFYGVGPGGGLTLEYGPLAGMVLLPTYIHGGSAGEISEFIYTQDKGVNWGRSQRATAGGTYDWSSESCLVQVGETRVRHFYRDGYNVLHFTDHTWENGQWVAGAQQTVVDAEGNQVTKTSGNQLSAILYSKKIDGKNAIVLSTANASGSARQHGCLYVMLLDDDAARTITKTYEYEVTPVGGAYAYSSISETRGGDIAVLYEGAGTTFTVIPMEDVVDGGVIYGERAHTQQITVPLYDVRTLKTNRDALTALETGLADKSVVTCAVNGDAATLVGMAPGTKELTYTLDGKTVNVTVKVEGAANREDVALTLPSQPTQTAEGLPVDAAVTYNSDEAVVTTALTPVTATVTLTNGAAAKQGNSSAYNGATVNMMDCLYTFTATGVENQYHIQSLKVPTLFLNISTKAKRPNGAQEAITVESTGDANGTFKIYTPGHFLYFGTTLHFDRTGAFSAAAESFYLYRPVASGATSTEIPGFVQVTSAAEIVSGQPYLVVAKVNNNCYALYPSSEDDDFAGSVHVTGTVASQSASWNNGYQLTLTGVKDGEATVMVNGKRYDVTVTTSTVDSVTISGTARVGDTLAAAATLSDGATVTDSLVSYQWYTVDGGGAEAAIDGATGSTYVPAAGDVDKRIKVTATGKGGYAGSAASTLTAPVAAAGAVVTDHTVTADTVDNGTITVSAATAAPGTQIAVTLTPAEGYKAVRDSVKVYKSDDESTTVTVTDDHFDMPAYDVTVTARFEPLTDLSGVKTALEQADYTAAQADCADLAAAQAAINAAVAKVERPEGVSATVTFGAYTAPVAGTAGDPAGTDGTYTFTVALAAEDGAEAVTEPLTLTITATAYAAPVEPAAPSAPAVTTDKTHNPDGSTTTTVTDHRTGTVTATTEMADGTVEVVETKKDGTVTETVTKPDGAVTESVTTPEGAVSTTARTPDGIVVKADTVPEAEDVTVSITVPPSILAANVSIPADIDYSTVAVDAQGNIVNLSVPTEALDAMDVRVEGSAALTLVKRGNRFEDIDGHWAEDSITFAAAHDFVNGTSETEFTPEGEMTRGMMFTLLARVDGVDTTGGDTWYAKGSQWAVDERLSDGTDLTGNITREQLATLLWRYAGCPEAKGAFHFADGDQVSAWAVEAMRWAVEQGIFEGTDTGELQPRRNATRAHAATVLLRFCRFLVK